MTDMMQKLGFRADEAQFFLQLRDTLSASAHEKLAYLKPRYLCEIADEAFAADEAAINEKTEAELTALAECEGVHPYSLHLLFLLEAALSLPAKYEAAGYDTQLAYDLLCDLRYKVRECERVYGIMGTSVFDWFHRHFLMKRFALGRFQYDPTEWISDKLYDFGDIHLTKGHPIVRFHIPSSGSFPRSERIASYKKAYDFFNKDGGLLILVCGSWLLYDGNRKVFPEGSNLLDFMDDFDMFSNRESEKVFPEAWRVFGRAFDGDTSSLPRETTLQRNYIKWLEAGNKVGSGAGVILFDGEKIINNKRDNG